jgi:hypothetical protein
MSFDAWLVGFGLSRTVSRLGLLPVFWSFQFLTATVIIDAILLKRFFGRRAARMRAASDPSDVPAGQPESM